MFCLIPLHPKVRYVINVWSKGKYEHYSDETIEYDTINHPTPDRRLVGRLSHKNCEDCFCEMRTLYTVKLALEAIKKL